MTEKRDLKRRVRDRQTETGESYMTALRQVLGQRETRSPVPVVEMVDLTDIAAPLGIKCAVKAVPGLSERVNAAAMLTQLRDALIVTANDASTALMRAVILAGERPQVRPEWHDPRPFLARARAGIGGVCETGRMLALSVAGRQGPEMVVFFLWILPPGFSFDRAPYVLVTTFDLFGDVTGWRVLDERVP